MEPISAGDQPSDPFTQILEQINTLALAMKREPARRMLLENGHSGELLTRVLQSLNILANNSRDSFRKTGSMESLEYGIKLLRIGLSIHPQGADRSNYFNDLAGALWEGYRRNGSLADLSESTQILRDALVHCPPGNPHRAETLSNLAICLQDRSKENSSPDDLDEAIEIHRAALALRPEGNPYRSTSLNNLSLCLRDRFKERGSPDDLDTAVTYSRTALDLRPEDHPLRPSCLSNLAVTLQFRYDLHGSPQDLQESIQLLRTALSFCPPHFERPVMQYNLSISLFSKFKRDSTLADLDEAIDLLRPLSNDQKTFKHPLGLSFINSLGNCLKERFWHLGSSVDLDEAIMVHAVAVEICPHNHTERSTFLNNLGTSFDARFTTQYRPGDLRKAIENHQAALTLRPPGHRDRSSSLNNLAFCYLHLFEHLGKFDDLVQAIEFSRMTLELCPEGHLLRPKAQANLGACLMARFTTLGDPSDLAEAIDLLRVTLSLRPAGHPDRTHSIHRLAEALQCRFERFHSTDDLNETFRLYSELPESTDGVSRWDLLVTRAWAEFTDKYEHGSAMVAYKTALTFLVRHAAIFPSCVEHYSFLKTNVSSLAVDAFSYFIRQKNIRGAVELLEQGRSVFWTQLTHLKAPLDELSSLGADALHLATEFKRLSSCLRTAFDQQSIFNPKQTWKLTKELEGVASRIRAFPGFSRFLLSPEFPDLQAAAKDGPVIVMNASQYTCDAVIIFHDKEPVHVELRTSKSDLAKLVSRFRQVVDKPRDFSTKHIAFILRDVWDCSVGPVVRVLQDHGILPQTRVWWCPTSDFTLLPLHAAGAFRHGEPKLSDLYVSSYTPTLGALLRARRQGGSATPKDKPPFLVVGASKPLGSTALPAVGPEIELVAEHVRDRGRVTALVDEDATIERVTDAFGSCKWLHLACHGIPNRKRPFESSFALHDGRLRLKKLVQYDLEDPEFAFLSACRTTVGDESVPDEAINLAAAMQFGGFRSVIGTILPVDDAIAGLVVSAFYTELLDGQSHLDCTRAAGALNAALKTLRGKIPFDQQIVFVHIGV